MSVQPAPERELSVVDGGGQGPQAPAPTGWDYIEGLSPDNPVGPALRVQMVHDRVHKQVTALQRLHPDIALSDMARCPGRVNVQNLRAVAVAMETAAVALSQAARELEDLYKAVPDEAARELLRAVVQGLGLEELVTAAIPYAQAWAEGGAQ